MDEWKREPGIQDPLVFDMQIKEDIDDDQTENLIYFPHKGKQASLFRSPNPNLKSFLPSGEKLDPDYEPSPVFLVKRVKTFKRVPYYHRETCFKLGLGEDTAPDKLIVVPNIPSMCSKLYSIKHLIEVILVKFPMGIPDDEDFDPAACRYVSKSLRLF